MTNSLSDLIAQKEAIERQIRDAKSAAKADAIAQVRKLMTQHDLTPSDLVAQVKGKRGVGSGSKVKPKYRDPGSGATWSGRGLKPKWLSAAIERGQSVGDFAI